MDLLVRLSRSPPELVWGLLSRGIGLVFLISFLSLRGQIVPLAGRRGITPIRDTLAAIRRDFPTIRRFLYFPSLLWLGSSDAVLLALPWLGMFAAGAVIVGGPHVAWALFACYVIYLSLDRAATLVYPWDCLLFEAGLWGAFLPATHVLPDVRAVSAPLPAIAWVFRLFVFRVMVGFGKHKFVGTTRQDAGFLRGFLVNQPLPTVPGWLSQKLPMWVLKLALAVMFVVEIPAPFAVFFPGPWSAAAGVAIILLMVGIWLTGNFGYFNPAMMVLTLSWFDSETARAFEPLGMFSSGAPVFVNALVVLHTLLALLHFPYNTFCAHTWMMWSCMARVRRRFLLWPVDLARALHPLRLAHAYGVFPPQSPPPAKFSPAAETSWDGECWEPLTHPYWPTLETSAPKFCAPHHERFDQAVVYESLGLNESSVYRGSIGRWDPYGSGGVPAALMFVHRLLEGTVPGRGFYDRSIEKGRGPPRAVRVRTYMLEPTSLGVMRSTGHWWKKTLAGPHFPPMTRADGYWDAPLPRPELWHPDDLGWLRRSRLGSLMKRALAGESADDLVRVGAEDLPPEDIQGFWTDFLPTIAVQDRYDWTGLRRTVLMAREKYGLPRLHRFERVASLYGVFLFAKLEPLFVNEGIGPVFGKVHAALDVKTYHHLRLLAHHIVAEGKDTYDSVMRSPSLAVGHAARMTMASGNFLYALFRYEALVFRSQKLRLAEAVLEHAGRPPLSERQQKTKERIEAIARRLFGALDVADFLKTQFTTAEDVLDVPENWPRFTIKADAEVVRVEGS